MEEGKGCLINCELFGRDAEYFESKVVPLWQETYDSLVSRARITKGAKVLDVGTGTGEVSMRAAGAVGQEGEVVGIDVQREMLDIAEKKARSRGISNVQLKRMPLEKLDLPDSTFDVVLGNYSLCCVNDYSAALSECFRVLKPGGRLTYNHGGKEQALEAQLFFKIFERYQTTRPSERLAALRASDAAQFAAVEKYQDQRATLLLMRTLGYESVEATTTQRVITYANAEEFVERNLAFDWRMEAEEIPKAELQNFREEAVQALSSTSKGPKFRVKDEMLYFTGTKKS